MENQRIAIIDYGMGNVGSIKKMLSKLGYEAILSRDTEELKECNKYILPGVGSFENGVRQLKHCGVYDFLKKIPENSNKHLLGICLGMQLLFEKSEEGPGTGLNLIHGEVKKFKNLDEGFKIPHMGWNFISLREESPIIKFLDEQSRFYFVHSYYAEPLDESNVLANTLYGNKNFASFVVKGNVYGTQFHPEKSHKFGFSLLKGFCDL